jgi:capsular exopolysaccharide synthesis family protein
MSSSVPGEGKSFLTINLGISYSLTGAKVLLVGGDMRKPVLHKPFKISVRKGLSSYLSSDENIDDIIFKTDFENLFVLPSGVVPPNPSELLEGEKFGTLMSDLKSKFDLIIIDTPPIGLVSDA